MEVKYVWTFICFNLILKGFSILLRAFLLIGNGNVRFNFFIIFYNLVDGSC